MVEHFILVLIHIMEKFSFDYSLKNIPLPDKRSCQLKLIEKIKSVLKRMRWKAHFFLSKENQLPETLKTYGLKSRNHPPNYFSGCVQKRSTRHSNINKVSQR